MGAFEAGPHADLTAWPAGTELLPSIVPTDSAQRAAHDLLELIGFESGEHPDCVVGIDWNYWSEGGHVASLYLPDLALTGEEAAELRPDVAKVIQTAQQYYAKRWRFDAGDINLEMSVSLSPPGTKVKIHDDKTESLVITLDGQGSGQLKHPKTGLFLPRFPLGTGDAVYVDKEIYHGFRNTGEGLRVVAVFS